MKNSNPLTDDYTRPDSFPIQRRLVTTPDGMKLLRQYIYLPASAWQAVEALMASRGHKNISQTIARLAMDAAKQEQQPEKAQNENKQNR
jgi:hypothetical protein